MGERAIVIGASMAGLVAARVVSDHVAEVTVIDRDDLPADPDARKGVAQGRHAHAILAAGEQALEALYPGLVDELVADGGIRLDTGRDARWFQAGAYRCTFDSDLYATSMSRPLLEHHVRRRTAALANVTIRPGTAVEGLVQHDGRVTGVRLADGSPLEADLVIDASGRSGQCFAFLTDLGYETPVEDRIQVGIGYTTAVYERRPDDLPGGEGFCLIPNEAPNGRLGVLLPMEGDRWILTLGGFEGDHPPKDDEGFLAFARSLPVPDIARVVERARPIGEKVTFRYPASVRRRFEKLARHPLGYVAIGDAVCSFNPIYGQGMSSAALQALALRDVLATVGPRSDALAPTFYKAAAKVVDGPWQIAAGADFAMPDTRGPKPPGTNLVNRYIRKVMLAAHTSPEVALAMYRVQHLLAPPPSLMKPAMMAKVFRAARRSPALQGGPIPEPLVIDEPGTGAGTATPAAVA